MPELETPWRRGRFGRSEGPRTVLFGRVYEDSEIEAAAFPAGSRVFCIASAGCTALRLAADRDVTAADINPVQLEYARARAEGAPMRRGSAERLMALGRPLLRLAGWSEGKVREFLSLDDPERQLRFWKAELDTRRFRLGVDALLSPRLLRAFYAEPYLHALPPRFGSIMRARMERCWSLHPNRANPYARALLLGVPDLEPAARPARPVRWVRADAAAFLEACAPASFDGFSLSNILDGAPEAYAARLFAAVRRAAAPGGVVVRRSFGEPSGPSATNLAARDRSILWGVVDVSPAGG